MNVLIKLLHPAAIAPVYSSVFAAGADVHARLDAPIYLHPGETKLVPLGFSMEMLCENIAHDIRPVAFLLPRSGLGHKHGIVLGNLVGVIDEDFRGEVMASLWNRNQDGEAFPICPGDRIGQMVIQEVRRGSFTVVHEISDTERGSGGFGSTGISTQGK
jgi:dUTP pyrophosphatase